MAKALANGDGFTAVELVLIVFILILIGSAGYVAFKRATAQTHPVVASNPTASSPAVNPHRDWKTAIFSGDNLKLRYPSNWLATTDPITHGLLLEKVSGAGKFIIRLEFAADGLIANNGSHDYKPISSFTFNSKPAYLVSDNVGGEYSLSSCPAPSLCFFAPKSPSQYKGISEDLSYYKTGQQMEDTMPSDPTSLDEAKQIMTTLSY